MKHIISVAALALTLTTFASASVANSKTKMDVEMKDLPDRAVTVETAISFGTPVLMIFTGYDSMVASPVAGAIDFRFGLKKWSQMRIELNTVIMNGVGANLIIDWLRIGENVKIHLIDPGILYLVSHPSMRPSVKNIPRTYDLTFGAGIDVRLNKNYGIGFNWRVFIPDIRGITSRYGGFSKVICSEAFKGGQWWLRFIHYAW